MTGVRILLDEHVGRVFEHVLSERGYKVDQAKDVFGEYTVDADLLEWCGDNGVVLISNRCITNTIMQVSSSITIRAVRIAIQKDWLER